MLPTESSHCCCYHLILLLSIASIDSTVVEFTECVVDTQIAAAAVMKCRHVAVIVVVLMVMVLVTGATSADVAAAAVV